MKKEAKLGLVLLLVLVVLAVFLFGVFGSGSQWLEPMVSFRTTLRDASGIGVGTDVRVAGLAVGKVTEVSNSADLNGVVAELNVTEQAAQRIREGSYASIQAVGMLGDRAINITPGDPSRPALAPGALIPLRQEEKRSPFANVGDALDKLSDRLAARTRTGPGDMVTVSADSLDLTLRVAREVAASGRALNEGDETQRPRLAQVRKNLRQVRAHLDLTLGQLDDMLGPLSPPGQGGAPGGIGNTATPSHDKSAAP